MSHSENRFVERSAEVRDAIQFERSELTSLISASFSLHGLLFAALAFTWDKGISFPIANVIAGLAFSVAFAIFSQQKACGIQQLVKLWKTQQPSNTETVDIPIIPEGGSDRPILNMPVLFSLMFFAIWCVPAGLLFRYHILSHLT